MVNINQAYFPGTGFIYWFSIRNFVGGLLQCLEILLVVTTEGEVCYCHLVGGG